ncbi:MAG: FAD:protein FMN transferase [Candidatus Pacebacteria bacterium]|nr:FAD:protein FMN transferase [Candidatus Paceibacterota bacterium]MDR3582871.1 FAD:protein FMN transferase [Candidatus Paceibacterota bacterium]
MNSVEFEKIILATKTKQTRILMGMPITVEILDPEIPEKIFNRVFDYFAYVDNRYSPFKITSEVSLINQGKIRPNEWSTEMKSLLAMAEETRQLSDGFFDVRTPEGKLNPSGIVKGWAIHNAANILKEAGVQDFYVDAGGDIEVHGAVWRIGIRNPWNRNENVKIVSLKNAGIATSGTYIRGDHIYNPKNGENVNEISSLTVIGPDAYEADRFATAGFAMGAEGINFIERLAGFEGYMIDQKGIATLTSGFEKYTYV